MRLSNYYQFNLIKIVIIIITIIFIYAVKITRIKVGLDNLKPHSKWHLEEVKIKILSKTYLFEAEKWFDKNLKGGSLEEELTPTQVFDKSKT